METTQHLIIAQMLALTEKSEEFIDEYKLSLPSLRLDSILRWEAVTNLSKTKAMNKMKAVVEEYKNLAQLLGVWFYANSSVR